jgi:hypothetical protein
MGETPGKTPDKTSSKYVLRTSEVRLLKNSLYTWFWICPICGYRNTYESQRRGIQAAIYHLRKKHKLEVEVVSD